MTKQKSPVTALTSSDAITRLSGMLKPLRITAALERQVIELAKDIGGKTGAHLTQTDMMQLCEFAKVSKRSDKVEELVDRMMADDDTDARILAGLLAKIQGEAALRRGLLRDLKATRNAKGSPKVADEDLGEWTGAI